MAKRKKRNADESVGVEEAQDMQEEVIEETLDEVQEEQEAYEQEAREEEGRLIEQQTPQEPDYQSYSPVEDSGTCLLVNRNNYPISIYFLNGDSTTLSPKQRASFPREFVNSGALPQGVSCL